MAIIYNGGYKFQLKREYRLQTDLKPREDISTEFVSLDVYGNLVIKSGYAWDGATCAIDTKTNIRGALVHDSLYQLMREMSYALPPEINREKADRLLQKICLEDGMCQFVAWLFYQAVHNFGSKYTDPKDEHLPEYAPDFC
ncbi:MAG: DUF1353 domain-containing protein [Methylococcaceae bacterium]